MAGNGEAAWGGGPIGPGEPSSIITKWKISDLHNEEKMFFPIISAVRGLRAGMLRFPKYFSMNLLYSATSQFKH